MDTTKVPHHRDSQKCAGRPKVGVRLVEHCQAWLGNDKAGVLWERDNVKACFRWQSNSPCMQQQSDTLAHLRYKCLFLLMKNLKRLWQKWIWWGQAQRRECRQTALLNSMALLSPVSRKVLNGVTGREPRLL